MVILQRTPPFCSSARGALGRAGEFYLINDLTLCLGSGAGDLLHVEVDRSCSFIELKAGAESVRILDFLSGGRAPRTAAHEDRGRGVAAFD